MNTIIYRYAQLLKFETKLKSKFQIFNENLIKIVEIELNLVSNKSVKAKYHR